MTTDPVVWRLGQKKRWHTSETSNLKPQTSTINKHAHPRPMMPEGQPMSQLELGQEKLDKSDDVSTTRPRGVLVLHQLNDHSQRKG